MSEAEASAASNDADLAVIAEAMKFLVEETSEFGRRLAAISEQLSGLTDTRPS